MGLQFTGGSGSAGVFQIADQSVQIAPFGNPANNLIRVTFPGLRGDRVIIRGFLSFILEAGGMDLQIDTNGGAYNGTLRIESVTGGSSGPLTGQVPPFFFPCPGINFFQVTTVEFNFVSVATGTFDQIFGFSAAENSANLVQGRLDPGSYIEYIYF